jgi:hypothetical protein
MSRALNLTILAILLAIPATGRAEAADFVLNKFEAIKSHVAKLFQDHEKDFSCARADVFRVLTSGAFVDRFCAKPTPAPLCPPPGPTPVGTPAPGATPLPAPCPTPQDDKKAVSEIRRTIREEGYRALHFLGLVYVAIFGPKDAGSPGPPPQPPPGPR